MKIVKIKIKLIEPHNGDVFAFEEIAFNWTGEFENVKEFRLFIPYEKIKVEEPVEEELNFKEDFEEKVEKEQKEELEFKEDFEEHTKKQKKAKTMKMNYPLDL